MKDEATETRVDRRAQELVASSHEYPGQPKVEKHRQARVAAEAQIAREPASPQPIQGEAEKARVDALGSSGGADVARHKHTYIGEATEARGDNDLSMEEKAAQYEGVRAACERVIGPCEPDEEFMEYLLARAFPQPIQGEAEEARVLTSAPEPQENRESKREPEQRLVTDAEDQSGSVDRGIEPGTFAIRGIPPREIASLLGAIAVLKIPDVRSDLKSMVARVEPAPSEAEKARANQDHQILGDPQHPDTRDYVATNLLAHIDKMPNSGDWHGQLKSWAQANTTGRLETNPAYEPAPSVAGTEEAARVELVGEIALWLRHIDRLTEIDGADALLPHKNPLWDASFALEEKFAPPLARDFSASEGEG